VKCSVYIAMSLDGFIARANGGLDWLGTVQRAGEDYGYQKFFDTVDTLIVGRNTYDTALGFDAWPYAGKRCIVMTHRGCDSRHGEEFFAGSPGELVMRLSNSPAAHAYVDGGVIIQQFLTAGLIDELTLSVLPILLGEGVRLFGETDRDIPLRLSGTKAFESGLVQLQYGVIS
jgi:dihydrofolate reductase